MIDRIIEFSAHNRFLVFLFVAALALAGCWSMQPHSARRHPRPERHAGHRLLALGPQPGHPGGPGHLSDRHRHAGRAQGEGRARLQRFRLLLRLHHLRGRHRYLLGALAHAGVSLEDSAAAAEGRADRTRSGCHRRRLGLPVRAGLRSRDTATISPSCAARRTGTCAITCNPFPAWPRSRRWAASSASIRSTWIPTGCGLRHSDLQGGGRGARRQQRRRRTAGGVHRPRVHGARPRLRALRRPTWNRSRSPPALPACPSWCATSAA